MKIYKKKKYIFENENEKPSKNKIEYISYYINFEDNICIFIKNNIYIFTFRGEIIRKRKIYTEFHSDKYYIIPFPYKYNNEQSYKYYYIIIFKNNRKNNMVFNIFEYNYVFNRNSLIFKNEIELPNLYSDKNLTNINNNNVFCNLMLNNSNKTLITFFYKTKNNNEFSFEIFEINIGKKIIKNLYLIKPQLNLKIGINIKFINNKDSTKTLICSNDKNKINCFCYDSIKNEFTHNINYFDNYNSKFNSYYEFNIDKINNKYILYYFSTQRKINIIELNEEFQYESMKIYEINKNGINLEFYNLIYKKRNYQILLYSTKNIYPSFKFINLSENITFKKLRILNGEGNDQNINNNNNNGNENNGNNNNNENNGNENNNNNDNNEYNGNNNGNENNDNNNENKENNSGNKDNNNNESKGNGETKEGYNFDFDNKETNTPKDQIKDNRNDIMNNIKPGESYDLKGDGYEIKVAPMGQSEQGSTSINFLSCENKLRKYYNLSNSSILTVFQTESETSSDRTLTNKVQYVVYDENNTQLDLSVCSTEQIRINYAIKGNSSLDTTLYSSFYEKGIDILNSSDAFFNDICYTYSDGTSDMTLADRIAEIYQNYSLCDSGCDYEGLDTENLTVSCSCSVITNDTEEDDDEEANIKEIVLGLFENSTFGVVKCYKLIFNFTNKKKNIGFWIFLILIIVHIPLYVLFLKME